MTQVEYSIVQNGADYARNPLVIAKFKTAIFEGKRVTRAVHSAAYERACDIWGALVNETWIDTTTDQKVGLTFRVAGDLLARAMENTDSYGYMDFYCSRDTETCNATPSTEMRDLLFDTCNLKLKTSFRQWCEDRRDWDSPIGDFVRESLEEKEAFPWDGSFRSIYDHLMSVHACTRVFEIFIDAWEQSGRHPEYACSTCKVVEEFDCYCD